MRALAVLIAVTCALGPLSASAAKRRKSPPKSAAQIRVRPEPEPSSKPLTWSTALGVGVGGFYGGGANVGPAVSASATFTPSFFAQRLALDAELQWRLSTFTTPVEGYGTLRSTAQLIPLVAALRFRLVQTRSLLFDLRAGAGPMLLVHQLSSDFSPTVTRSGLGWDAFAGAQLRIPFDAWELTADVRYALGEAPVPFILGRNTGLQVLVGARFSL